MKSKKHIIISCILLLNQIFLFALFGLWPIIDFLIGKNGAGHIIFIITIPLTFILLVFASVYFGVSLMKYKK